MRRLELALLFAFGTGVVVTAALASETIDYSYDAQGRVVNVVHTGTVNNNVQANYTHDNADNRANVTVTGSPNPPPP